MATGRSEGANHIRMSRTFRRRDFLKLGAVYGGLLGLGGARAKEAPRPNVLWITTEDHGQCLGCYGDPSARTPNIDSLAKDGVRYTNAFANAPVCAPARCTLILGMYASTLGTQQMRSRYPVPAEFRPYPYYLRDAGYYCTNNAKTDYNFQCDDAAPWDECGRKAHYKNRPAGAPFFSIFNLGFSHESQIRTDIVQSRREEGVLPETPRLRPDEITLPPYHPDLPEIREDWVRFYDNIDLLDKHVGQLLRELEEEGLAEDTIVFYYSDHGGNLSRSKRFLFDTGTRVSCIVHFPKKWRHLAPSGPGTPCDRVVSFVDFAPTLLNLLGVDVPSNMQGAPFLGKQSKEAEPYAFLYRNRMDERYDFSRAITDGRFRYVRNFMPHRIYGQHLNYPFTVQQNWWAWEDAYKAGQCNALQSAFWQPKPPEELYDITTDPWEVSNLADDPAYGDKLRAMRAACFKMMAETRDTGFIPESMYEPLSGDKTLYDFAQSGQYPLARVMDLAGKATSRDVSQLPELMRAMAEPEALFRYWGAIGCAVLGAKASEAKDRLLELLEDPVPAVRTAAAEALAGMGERDRAIEALRPIALTPDDATSLEAFNALDLIDAREAFSPEELQQILDNKAKYGNACRIVEYWRQDA